MTKVKIKQFKNKAKEPVAGLTPEHAVYDANGVRLDAKLGNVNLQEFRDLQQQGVNAIKAQEKESLELLKEYDHETIINNGTIVNAVDEEDLTTRDNVISLKDRNPLEGGEMGYVILRKNKSFAEQVTKENTIYEIRYNFDITTKDLPGGCTLKFDGGKLRGGTLIGNQTRVINNSGVIFEDVILNGTFLADSLSLSSMNTTKVDYLFSFISAFSGTQFYMTKDISLLEFNGDVDSISASTININGNGHILDLYSFPAHNVKACTIRDITINTYNNIPSSWHNDAFNFGIVCKENSHVSLNNVAFSTDTKTVYVRGASNLSITNNICTGTYYFIYECGNIILKDNKITDAERGCYFISKHDISNHITITDNYLENISKGGIILTGGLKYNVSILNNILVNVGSGGAENAAINIHPKGKISINNNNVTLNEGALAFDIDAARTDMFDINTDVQVLDNVVNSSNTIERIALVGLGKLIVKNNYFTNVVLSMWDNPNCIIENNTFDVNCIWDNSKKVFTYQINYLTQLFDHQMWFKHNIVKITNNPNNSYVNATFTGYKTSTHDFYLYSIDNVLYGWNKRANNGQIECVLFNFTNNCHICGDLAQYDKNFSNNEYIKGTDNTYISTNGIAIGSKYAAGFKGFDITNNKEYRGTLFGIQDIHGNPAGTKYYGTTAQRPTSCLEGTMYYDTTLHKHIFAKGTKAKLNVRILGDLISNDGNYVIDTVTINVGKYSVQQYDVTNSISKAISIFEYYLDHIKKLDTSLITKNWSDYTVGVISPYVGEIGTDYSVIHSNPDGYKTEHVLANDGTILWVDATGEEV